MLKFWRHRAPLLRKVNIFEEYIAADARSYKTKWKGYFLADLYFVQQEVSSELLLVLNGSPIYYHMFSVLPGLKDVNKKLSDQNKILLEIKYHYNTKYVCIYLRSRQRCNKAKHWSDPPQSHNDCIFWSYFSSLPFNDNITIIIIISTIIVVIGVLFRHTRKT